MRNEIKMKKNSREIIFFLFITVFVLVVNQPVIDYNMFYPEQPLIFLANEKIHSLRDLVNIYTHPQLFHLAIPFFRPSGHFLIYQVLTPFLGWHCNKSLIIINLIFLSSIGYLSVKIYQRLFPEFKYGGYIAFAIYLMHPALNLSRLIILHFEFAYVFFSLLSLYYFVVFLQKNANTIALQPIKNNLQSMSLLFFSLFFYVFAVSFKEAALVMGGVLLTYYFVFLYSHSPQTMKQFFLKIFYTKELWQIFILLVLVPITLALYIALSWSTFSHPFQKHIDFSLLYLSSKEFFKLTFGFGNNFHSNPIFGTYHFKLRSVIFPFYTRGILWFSMLVCLASLFILFFSKQHRHNVHFARRKSCIFLIIASLIALALPLLWGAGQPWHLSLTLLFLSILFGFSFEYVFNRLLLEKMDPIRHASVLAISLSIGLTAYGVNQKNIQRIILDQDLNFKLKLNRNAILHPPRIKQQLNTHSLVVVEDGMEESYMFGAGFYPLQITDPSDYILVKKRNHMIFLKIKSHFNGTLFRWAYLFPNLREELYPFQIDKMKNVSDETIYDWLQSYKNIFCLAYDEKANWLDKTSIFKQQLLKEQLRRNIRLHHYTTMHANAFGSGNVYKVKKLDYADVKICKYICSQDKQCRGFNYINVAVKGLELHQCHFMDKISTAELKVCSVCEAYRKIEI